MGFKDRLNKLKEAVSTGPIDLTLTQQGTQDPLLAGQPATVYVLVKGENDGSVDRIDLVLNRDGTVELPLGQVPITAGKHAVAVEIPTGLPPSVGDHISYTVRARAIRNKGLNHEATLPIDVVARPEDLAWPEGPRAGQDGDAPQVQVVLARDTVDQGASVTGSVRITAAAGKALRKADVRVAIAYVVTRADQKDRREEVGHVDLDTVTLEAGRSTEVPFAIELPAGSPATYGVGGSSITWRVEAKVGKTTGWTLFGALDPKADGGNRARSGTSIASVFASGSPQ